jgi:phosphoglycerate kinase
VRLPGLGDLEGVEGARVLLRLDLNVPVRGGVVQDDTRIRAALPTARWLAERAALVAACSHLGKAKGAADPAFSLAPAAAVLEQALGRPVRFVHDCLDPGRVDAEAGTFLLLENLRFHPGEKANDREFANRLAAPFSHYVNDAFGTAHREHASVAAAASLFGAGSKAAGLLIEREVAALGRIVSDPEAPFVAVVGGAKISTKTAPLQALTERVQGLLVGGGMANTFLLAAGHEVGQSLVEEEMLDTARQVLSRARERGVALELPSDLVVTDELEHPARTQVVAADSVPPELMIVDVGPDTRSRYREVLAEAKTVFWNGPMGVFEIEEFGAGTLAVAQSLAEVEGFTVVGGGESVMAIHRAGVASQIDHVSTGGGASLQFLTGETLPAMRALEAE